MGERRGDRFNRTVERLSAIRKQSGLDPRVSMRTHFVRVDVRRRRRPGTYWLMPRLRMKVDAMSRSVG